MLNQNKLLHRPFFGEIGMDAFEINIMQADVFNNGKKVHDLKNQHALPAEKQKRHYK